jgi:aerobic C4-dicarboxylate transport protein
VITKGETTSRPTATADPAAQATGVTGSGFIGLAATPASLVTVLVAGIALIFGVDRFMSEARARINLIGNGVATVVVARWEVQKELVDDHAHDVQPEPVSA